MVAMEGLAFALPRLRGEIACADTTEKRAGLPPPSPFVQFAGQIVAFLRFYSRLPIPAFLAARFDHAGPDFARALWALPIAGAVIGGCGALAGALAFFLGLAPLIAATLAVATLVIVTGAFHEDGLADSADGLFGGATSERRLEIMRDSRIGTFGAAALALSLLLRILAFGEILRLAGPAAFLLLIGIAALSRTLSLLPALLLPPARASGLSASNPMPGYPAFAAASGLSFLLLLALTFPLDLAAGAAAGTVVASAVLLGVTRLARAKIGGQTGDILGASQQITEIMILLALSATLAWIGPR